MDVSFRNFHAIQDDHPSKPWEKKTLPSTLRFFPQGCGNPYLQKHSVHPRCHQD